MAKETNKMIKMHSIVAKAMTGLIDINNSETQQHEEIIDNQNSNTEKVMNSIKNESQQSTTNQNEIMITLKTIQENQSKIMEQQRHQEPGPSNRRPHSPEPTTFRKRTKHSVNAEFLAEMR